MSSSSAGGSKSGRGQDRNKQLIKEYEEIVLAAELKAGEEVSKLLADAAKLLEAAGRNYTHAVDQGRAAFHRIHEPARDNYQRQFTLALEVQNSIINPAQNELTRITESVKELIKQAIQPIEQVYSDMLSEAGNISSGITLGGQPGG